MTHIAPSLLAANFANLTNDIHDAEQAGADLLHIDIMDGQFVPNISFGPDITRAISMASSIPLDVHLMIEAPERFIADFATVNPKYITVHPEATVHLHRTLSLICERDVIPGVALTPLTPLTLLEEVLPLVGIVVVMSVNPGFGGQSFIPESLDKIARVKALRDELNPECVIEVDGGVNTHTARDIRDAGADILVAGSAVFNDTATVKHNMKQLRDLLAE